MATGDIPMRQSGGLSDIQSLLDMVAGKTTTQAGTTTSAEIVDPAKSLEFINQMLSGTAGLAAVSGAQRGAGLYNSTTNKLLTNDLLARTAAQSAALSTVKTSTNNNATTQQAQLTAQNAAKAAAAAAIAKALAAAGKGGGGKGGGGSGGGSSKKKDDETDPDKTGNEFGEGGKDQYDPNAKGEGDGEYTLSPVDPNNPDYNQSGEDPATGDNIDLGTDNMNDTSDFFLNDSGGGGEGSGGGAGGDSNSGDSSGDSTDSGSTDNGFGDGFTDFGGMDFIDMGAGNIDEGGDGFDGMF